MSLQSGEMLRLPPTLAGGSEAAAGAPFPDGAYRANLYVYDPFGRIDWYALVPGAFADGRFFTIGRGSACNIGLHDGSVSTRHACIAAQGGQLVLRDLGSTNGSQVNGQKVGEHTLRHGDVIRLGATDMRFLYSYRESAVHLVLGFQSGPNAGRSVATFGSSTTIGRLNCAINLHGADVAAQHVRIDAYGRELMFVVNLARENMTWLNERRVLGIAPAREGDVLQVGDHRIVLRIAEPAELSAATPQADGTLLIEGPPGAADPVARVSADDLARVEAHLLDLSARPGFEPTVHDLHSGGFFVSPTSPPEPVGPGLTDAADLAVAPQDTPEGRWRGKAEGRAARAARRSRLLPWLAVLCLLGGALAALALVPVPHHLALPGALAPAGETLLVAPARGRVDQLYVRAGDEVVAGDPIAHVVDLEVQSELDRLMLEIEALERGEGAGREGPGDAALARITGLLARRDELKARRVRVVRAEAAGRLLDPSEGPIPAGAMVRAGQPLFRLADPDRLRLRLEVPGPHLGAVERAGVAELVPEGMSDQRFEVRLGPVGPAANANGTFPLEVTIINPEGRLRAGQRVTARVPQPDVSGLGWLWRRITAAE